MAGLFDGLMKGLASLAPQDSPDVKIFNAQNELKYLTKKEDEVFAQLGRQVYEKGGAEEYPELLVQLQGFAATRTELNERIAQIQAEKDAKDQAAREKAEAEAAAAREKEEAEAAARAAAGLVACRSGCYGVCPPHHFSYAGGKHASAFRAWRRRSQTCVAPLPSPNRVTHMCAHSPFPVVSCGR